MNSYPTILFRSPQDWGEETMADEATMQALVDQLRHNGFDISIDECDKLELVDPITGTYRMTGMRDEWLLNATPDGDCWKLSY